MKIRESHSEELINYLYKNIYQSIEVNFFNFIFLIKNLRCHLRNFHFINIIYSDIQIINIVCVMIILYLVY